MIKQKLKLALGLAKDVKESIQVMISAINSKDIEVVYDEPEQPEEESVGGPRADIPKAFATMSETQPDTHMSYVVTLTSEKLNSEIRFHCSWEEWREDFNMSPYDLITYVINRSNNLDDEELDPEIVEEWANQFGPAYAPTMLWVLAAKHDNYYELGTYNQVLSRLEKDKTRCRFNDLPDQNTLLN